MSTKTNVRSPFFLDLTAPVQTLGTFTCTTAGLSNFAVASSGFVTNPLLLAGSIVGQTATEFTVNTTGSSIPRSVTYTIAIPLGYTNVNDATIDCVQDFDQPTQAANENPNINNNCPTFAGTIPNTSGLASTTINLATYFTSGSGADISSYVVTASPSGTAISAVLTGTAPSQTLTLSTNTDCQLATFIITARQSSDNCTAISNSFTFDSANCGAYDCNVANIVGGSIDQDGTLHIGTHIGTINALFYDGTDITSSRNVGVNNTGSLLPKTITYRFNIPNGYSNSGTYDCDEVYDQLATLRTFDCAEAQISNTFISEQGNIAAPTLGAGTLVSWTPQSFAEVSLNTIRTITFTITPPSSDYINSGGSNITCDVPVTQPATRIDCGTTQFGFGGLNSGLDRPEDFCNGGLATSFGVGGVATLSSTVASFEDLKSTVGNTVCYRLSTFRGDNKYYVIGESYGSTAEFISNRSDFYMLKIDQYGTVQEVVKWNCDGGGDGAGARVA